MASKQAGESYTSVRYAVGLVKIRERFGWSSVKPMVSTAAPLPAGDANGRRNMHPELCIRHDHIALETLNVQKSVDNMVPLIAEAR